MEDIKFATTPVRKRDIIANLRISKDEELGSTQVKDKEFYYEFKELLGEGAFCKVYKALYKPTQEILAIKVI